MSFPSATLLLCLWLSSAIAYKLPLLDGSLLTHDDNLVHKPNNSPFGINYKWEFQTEDIMDGGSLMLPRLRREVIDKKSKKGDVIPDKKPLPKVKPTEPPLDKFSDATPYILEASSAAITKAKSMHLLNEDETTPLTDQEQTTKGAGQTLSEDETTPLTDIPETTKEAVQKLKEVKTTHVSKSVTQSEALVTESTFNPTTSEGLADLTSKKYTKPTQVDHAPTTASQDTSSKQTSPDDNLKDSTSSLSPQSPESFPSTTPATSHYLTTGHRLTTIWFWTSSTKPAAVTPITTSSADAIQTQSIMRQCMLTILILAVACTIFLITTIALAAKLSTMKQRNKLRHPVAYTEMRCISSLLPDDQQNKPQPKRLKTFASAMEESDGDNTTLHSFLPDHY
ncbi:hypothetical protein GDO81_002043 [Engystomops pustulosus]|uniref:P-selectin glycoprotein ligand 1 n=1 Tax=Engystomops pustulosus TaxID=76066 RepID=A0AAV7DKJ9_ENGPU|nr:hypothetical protein GDO81_002043 [Engystomops pustulosus]